MIPRFSRFTLLTNAPQSCKQIQSFDTFNTSIMSNTMNEHDQQDQVKRDARLFESIPYSSRITDVVLGF